MAMRLFWAYVAVFAERQVIPGHQEQNVQWTLLFFFAL